MHPTDTAIPAEPLFRLDRLDAALLCGLLAAFAASRLLWLATNFETSVYWEDGYRWVAALELLRGPALPLVDYQADPYQGGPPAAGTYHNAPYSDIEPERSLDALSPRQNRMIDAQTLLRRALDLLEPALDATNPFLLETRREYDLVVRDRQLQESGGTL